MTRIDREESAKSFLQRLGRSENSLAADDPTDHEIAIFDDPSPRHQYNTALFIHHAKEPSNNTRGRNRAEKKVSTVVSNMILLINFLEKTDLELVVTQGSEDAFSAELTFSKSHTGEDMAGSVLRTFKQTLSQLISGPHIRLGNINVCSEWDREAIKNSTGMRPTGAQSCLHDLILRQCHLRPDQIAVCSWDGDLTYRQLNDLSSRLALHLIQLGVGPETFVVSCFQKSTWAVVARLAILRAGGAYISINARDPPVYLSSVISRTKPKVLLTDSRFANQFRDVVPILEALSPEWLQGLPTTDAKSLCQNVQPDNACLVLFTSGTTGTPKGIIQTHQSYVTAIQNYARDLKLGPHTRYLQYDDYTFDISNLEFLVPLIVGGCTCIPGPMRTVHDLTRQIVSLHANITFLTPTVAIKLEPASVPCLETICVGGEPLPKELVAKWNDGTTRLINQYGMGEVAICCALNDNVTPVRGAEIGRPSTGALWLVDPSTPEKLVPVGAVGEILIEGPHLSRGYLDRVSVRQTGAGFLSPTPKWMSEMHPERNSARLYRSGDLGRRNASGTVTYLGRKDTILKLDGCRIDALEVEDEVRKCLSAEDAVVVDLLGIVNGREDPTLTAFLYFNEHPHSTAALAKGVPFLKDAEDDPIATMRVKEIKATLKQSLGLYMIPTTFVLVSWIPRTASKKVDRKKLHMLGQSFYFSHSEERSKDVMYAQKIQALPV